MSNLQYFHNKSSRGYTVCIEVDFTANDLMNMLQKDPNSMLNVKVGVANVYYKDSYNKKIGRETSKSRLTNTLFWLEKVSILEDGKYLWKFVRSDNGDGMIIRTSNKSVKPHLISYR